MNKIERIKAEKDGLDVYDELMRAAREGYDTLEDSDMALLKWYGLYQHNTQDGHFMLRTKWPSFALCAYSPYHLSRMRSSSSSDSQPTSAARMSAGKTSRPSFSCFARSNLFIGSAN